MTRLAWFASFCLLAGPVSAGTFEISDPANEMYEEQQAQAQAQAQAQIQDQPEGGAGAILPPRQEESGNILCTVDTATGACSCIDEEMAKKLSMTQQDCVDHVLQALETRNP